MIFVLVGLGMGVFLVLFFVFDSLIGVGGEGDGGFEFFIVFLGI